MTLADDITTDLANMLDDWGDTITIGGTAYNGIYDQDFIESLDHAGFSPVFTMTNTDASASSVARGDTVQITSSISGLASKIHTVRVIERPGEGVTRLVLSE